MATAKIDVKTDLHGSDKELEKVDKSLKGMSDQAAIADSTSKGLWKQFALGALAVVALKEGFRILTGFVKESIEAAIEQERVEAALEAVLKSTKNAAGLNKDELLKMASALQKTTTFGDEAIVSAENLLLTFTNIGKKVFPDALEIVLDMSTALGQDLKSSAIQVGKALQDPILGVTALRRVGVNFNETQTEMIKGLVKSGETLEAQKFILEELQTEFGGAAAAAADTFGGALKQLGNVWGDLKEKVGETVTENEGFKEGIVKLKDEIIVLIESGKLEEWLEGAAKGVEKFLDVAGLFGSVLTDGMAGPAKNVADNLFGITAEAKRIEKEGVLAAIAFRDSLVHLEIPMSEIKTQFEKGGEKAALWMADMKNLDDQMVANEGTYKTLAEKGLILLGLIEDTSKPTEDLSEKFSVKLNPALFDSEGKVKLLEKSFKDIASGENSPTAILQKAIDDAADSFSDFPVELDLVRPAMEDIIGGIGLSMDEMNEKALEAAGITSETMLQTASDAIDAAEEQAEKTAEIIEGFATDIGNAFGQFFVDILDSSNTFEEDMAALWDNIKMAFINVIADMIAEWTTGFIIEILTSSKAAEGAIAGIGTAATGTGTAMTGAATAGTGLGISLGGIAAIAGVALIILGGFLSMNDAINVHWEEQRAVIDDMIEHWLDLGMSIREASDRLKDYTEQVTKANEEEGKRGTGGPKIIIDRPGIGGPRIGGFAEGGIAWTPQIATIAEKGPEIIIPLDKVNTNTGSFNSSGNSPMQVVLKIDGQTLAEILSPHIAEQARLGNLPFEQQNFVRSET